MWSFVGILGWPCMCDVLCVSYVCRMCVGGALHKGVCLEFYGDSRVDLYVVCVCLGFLTWLGGGVLGHGGVVGGPGSREGWGVLGRKRIGEVLERGSGASWVSGEWRWSWTTAEFGGSWVVWSRAPQGNRVSPGPGGERGSWVPGEWGVFDNGIVGVLGCRGMGVLDHRELGSWAVGELGVLDYEGVGESSAPGEWGSWAVGELRVLDHEGVGESWAPVELGSWVMGELGSPGPRASEWVGPGPPAVCVRARASRRPWAGAWTA